MLLNFLIALAAAFGGFQLIVLLLLWKKILVQKLYLVPLILGISWILLEFLAVRNIIPIKLSLFYGTQYGSWLLLGPSFWFYWQVFVGKTVSFKKYLVHLIPFFLFSICLPLILPDLISDRANHYGMLTVLAYHQLGFTFWQGFYALIFILQFFHLAAYLWQSARLIKQKNTIKKTFEPWLKWSLYGMMAIILGASIFFGQMLLTSYQYIRLMDYFYALPFAAYTFFLTFKFTLFPFLLRNDLKIINSLGEKYQKSNLDAALLKAYAKRLETGMQQQNLYKNPDITLTSLAKELNISPHHLSLVLNSQFNQKFYEYINVYRIKAAKKLLRTSQQTSIQIALDVGFNNKATFHKYFKKYTHTTPSQFRKGIK